MSPERMRWNNIVARRKLDAAVERTQSGYDRTQYGRMIDEDATGFTAQWDDGTVQRYTFTGTPPPLPPGPRPAARTSESGSHELDIPA